MQTGSRLDRNHRDVAALPDNTLDRLVLRNVDAAFKRTRAAPKLRRWQRQTRVCLPFSAKRLTGKQSRDAAVKAFAAALPAGGADRLLVILKHRSEARIPVRDGTHRPRAPGRRRFLCRWANVFEISDYGLYRDKVFSRRLRTCDWCWPMLRAV